jgi:ATP-binding cassette subfamily C (CFTR/MRP) protein 1
MRVRAGLVTAIYKKALVLSNDERAARASGDIVNLQSVDATRLQDLCTYGLIAISGPLQVGLKSLDLCAVTDFVSFDRLFWPLCPFIIYWAGLRLSEWPS